MDSVLISSGLLQAAFAVLLGWPLTVFYAGAKSVGPLKSARRLLQAHIDNVLMALLQLAIAAVHPAIPEIAGWMLVAGSWINPQLFLLGAINPEATLKDRASLLGSLPSFLMLSVAYIWLVVAWFRL